MARTLAGLELDLMLATPCFDEDVSYLDHRLMAKSTVTHITDDIDGSKDASEVSFALNGAEYTIDLSSRNQKALAKALQPYIEAGTRVARRGSTRKAAASSSGRSDLAAVRAWAAEQGIEVSERGRVSKAVLEQYDAAN